MRSIKEALKIFMEWYGVIGFVFGVFAIINLCVSIYHIDLNEFIRSISRSYQIIAHTFVGWLFFWLPFSLPTFAKDVVVIWLIVGGAVARTQDRFMRVRAYHLKETIHTALGRQSPRDINPDTSPYFERIYNHSPRWFRILADILFWPRRVYNFFRRPFASVGKTRKYTWYDINEKKSDQEKSKQKEGYLDDFDLRIVFFAQIFVIISTAIFVLALNTFAPPNL